MPLTELTPWHEPLVRRILAQLRPSDVVPAIQRNVVGPDCWVWHPATDRADRLFQRLRDLRTSAVENAVGYRFVDAGGHADRAAYLAVDETFASVEDAVASRFADPAILFGAVPAWNGGLGLPVKAVAAWQVSNQGARAALALVRGV